MTEVFLTKSGKSPVADAPSPFRSRTIERGEKREALLLAAVRLFNAKGFHAASLDDVAASLNVSKPLIYHYLGNKEQVLFECVARGLEQLRAAAARAKAVPGDGLEQLRSFLRLYAAVTMDDFGRCVIRTADECLSAESAARFRALKREIDDTMREFIERGVKDGSIGTPDIKLVAFTLAGALSWPARWHHPQGPLSAATIAERMVDILTTGIATRSPSVN